MRGVDLVEWHAALFEWFELVAYATVSTLQSKRSEAGRYMSIILIVDNSRSLSIKFDTNQLTNIGCR